MGNEEGYLILQKNDIISIELEKDGYYESQLLTGNIKFELNDDITINEIIFKIRLLQAFRVKQLINQYINNFSQDIILTNALNISNLKNFKNNKIPKGINRIPFSFFLPSNLVPSFEYPKDDKKSFIRYILSAEFSLENKKYITEEYIYIKQRPFNVPSLIKNVETKPIRSFGSSKGEATLNLYITTYDIRINDPLNFTVEIDNTKCQDNAIQIIIKVFRIITFKKNDTIVTDETNIIKKECSINCLKGEKESYKYEDILMRDNKLEDMNFEGILNPYNDKITDLNLLMPSLEAAFIKCEYKLEVSVKYSCSSELTVTIPLYFVHQLLLECEGDKTIIEKQKTTVHQGHPGYCYAFSENDKNKNKNYENNPFSNLNINHDDNSKLNPYSAMNNFGQKKKNNNNQSPSPQISPEIENANPYSEINNDFPTLESIMRVENQKKEMENNNNNNNVNNNNNNNNNENNINKRPKGKIKYKDLFP